MAHRPSLQLLVSSYAPFFIPSFAPMALPCSHPDAFAAADLLHGRLAEAVADFTLQASPSHDLTQAQIVLMGFQLLFEVRGGCATD